MKQGVWQALLLLATLACYGSALGEQSKFGLSMFGLDNDEDDYDDQKIKDDPKPCCFPETWQGVVETVLGSSEGRGKATGQMTSTQVFIDGQKKRVAGKVDSGKKCQDFTFVGFYNETSGKGFQFYAFRTVNATKCWGHYWDKFEYQKPCLPANSTFGGSFHVGLVSGGLGVNAWSLGETRGKFSFFAQILVTADGCAPIAFREIGKVRSKHRPGPHPHEEEEEEEIEKQDTGVVRLLFKTLDGENQERPKPRPRPKRNEKKFVVGAIYRDIELQIKDEKVFNVPDICKKHVEEYPSTPEEIDDPEVREGMEMMEAIMERVII